MHYEYIGGIKRAPLHIMKKNTWSYSFIVNHLWTMHSLLTVWTGSFVSNHLLKDLILLQNHKTIPPRTPSL